MWPCSLWRYEWFHQFPQDEYGCGELLSLSHPELIKECHREVLKQGVDAVVTNTSGATSLIMRDYGAAGRVRGANRESARLALEACGEVNSNAYAVGSLGPTTTQLTLNHAPASVVEQAYFEQASALYEAGIRVFYLEGCQDPLNALAALRALTRLETQFSNPVGKVVTVRVLENGNTLFGTSLNEFWELVHPFSPLAFGPIGRFEDVREAISSISRPEVPLAAMIDVFAVASPEGWIESPESLCTEVASLRTQCDIRIIGTGIISEPGHIRFLVQSLHLNS